MAPDTAFAMDNEDSNSDFELIPKEVQSFDHDDDNKRRSLEYDDDLKERLKVSVQELYKRTLSPNYED